MSEKKEKKGAEGGKGIARGYGMNECPRPAELGAFGLQHALLILFQTLPAPLLIAGGLGFGPLETSILIASALFVSGICTFVQSFGVGPLGAKIPMVQVGSFVFIAPALLIAPQAGFGGYMGACIVAAIVCGVVFVLFSDWLKVIFPSFISGAVLLVLGTGLIGNALANCAGGSGAETFGDPVNLALAAATFLITLVLSVFGKGFLQGAAPLIGMAVGFVIAICMGMVDFSSVSEAAWFGLPQPLHWGISFPVDACLVMTLVAVCGVVEILGTTAATTTVAAGRMATPGETKKTVLTQAVGSVFAGLFNAVPTISGSANIGLMDVTRVFTRYAVSVAGGFILLMGLCPKLLGRVLGHPQSRVRRRRAHAVRLHPGQRHEDHHGQRADVAHADHPGRVVGRGHRLQLRGRRARPVPVLGVHHALRRSGHRLRRRDPERAASGPQPEEAAPRGRRGRGGRRRRRQACERSGRGLAGRRLRRGSGGVGPR